MGASCSHVGTTSRDVYGIESTREFSFSGLGIKYWLGESDWMLLYSTNTWLAHQISRQFYDGRHWVYCAPAFAVMPVLHYPTLPPSSCPKDIYATLHHDCAAKDRHSAKILQNRAGLKKGSLAKRAAGLISDQEAADIDWMVDNAEISDFRPLLYVIPRAPVATRLKRVSAKAAANMFSEEYILEDLADSEFHALELY
jgi:hypothetical protein